MKYAIPLLLALSACGGSKGNNPSNNGIAVVGNPSSPTSITLSSSLSYPGLIPNSGVYVLPNDMKAIVPATLSPTANGSQAGTAVLYFGSISCTYSHAANASVYTLPGGCTSGYNANGVISLPSGTTITLVVQNNGYTNNTALSASVGFQ